MARIAIDEYFGPEKRSGRLVVVREVEGIKTKGNGTIRKALFRCDCGVEKIKRLSEVKSGAVQSCGCLHREMASGLAAATATKHGDAKSAGRAPEYQIYRAMLNRCFNTKVERYPEYGGRGITVADEWRGDGGYQRFLADVGRRPSKEHSLDRIDPNGNYMPGNVRWAVKETQANNKRNSVRMKVGERDMTLREMSEKCGLGIATIRYRLKQGLSPEKAMTEPVKSGPHAKA